MKKKKQCDRENLSSSHRRIRVFGEWGLFLVVLLAVGVFITDGSFYRGLVPGAVERDSSYTYSYAYGFVVRQPVSSDDLVVLSALRSQTAQFRLNIRNPNFHWEVDSDNPSCVAERGSTEFIAAAGNCQEAQAGGALFSFSAPQVAGAYVFYLYYDDVPLGDDPILLGKYMVTVESPAQRAADDDGNGIIDNADLISLFQDWNSHPAPNSLLAEQKGYDVTDVLTVILCELGIRCG